MKIRFALYISEQITKFSGLFRDIEEELNKYLEKKEYGSDIIEIEIGIICVESQFEPFFKPRKPKYTKEKKYEKDGAKYHLNRVFGYDLKLEFDTLINASGHDAQKILVDLIFKSFSTITANYPKLDFQIDEFKNDVATFFKE
jgi:hypothetical protein